MIFPVTLFVHSNLLLQFDYFTHTVSFFLCTLLYSLMQNMIPTTGLI